MGVEWRPRFLERQQAAPTSIPSDWNITPGMEERGDREAQQGKSKVEAPERGAMCIPTALASWGGAPETQALETTVSPPKFFVAPVLRSGRRTPEPMGMAWKQERKGFQVLRGPWTKDASETNCQSPRWGGCGHLGNTSVGTKMKANCHVLLPLPKTLTSAQGKWGTLHSLRLNFSTLVKYDLE